MFGFGNSKQKKYKKALEEFLQKMMSVKDYFEIIQSRGKGHAQMAEMLGVKVSDTDYWAKEHFEEYKSRFSQSNDPLADIELRLKNFSFIKKEMEGFINYAKELEMNLTPGFVDDYYATVSTLMSLENVKKEFSDTKFNVVGTFYSDGKNIDKEFIKVELLGNNTGLVKQKIFQFNNLVEVDSNCINENFETVEKFYDEEKEKQNFLIYTELSHLSYFEYFCSSITLIKRLDNYPKDFTKINIKVRGLGFYSTNREVQIEVDKIEFLKLTSTYWLTFFSDHTSENIVGSSHRSADESFGMIKKLNEYYPDVYFAECWEEKIDFKEHEELYIIKKYFVDDKLNISYINIYGPNGFFQSKYFLAKPEELKNSTNEISEEKYDDLEDDSEYNYMTFLGIDYYLREEFEKMSNNENFHQVFNGGMFNKIERENISLKDNTKNTELLSSLNSLGELKNILDQKMLDITINVFEEVYGYFQIMGDEGEIITISKDDNYLNLRKENISIDSLRDFESFPHDWDEKREIFLGNFFREETLSLTNNELLDYLEDYFNDVEEGHDNTIEDFENHLISLGMEFEQDLGGDTDDGFKSYGENNTYLVYTYNFQEQKDYRIELNFGLQNQ